MDLFQDNFFDRDKEGMSLNCNRTLLLLTSCCNFNRVTQRQREDFDTISTCTLHVRYNLEVFLEKSN